MPVVASPTPAGVEEPEALDAVRALQHALYRAAKADPGRRFHALYDKLSRGDVLQRAWEQVRRNQGAPGIDQVTIQQVERYGLTGCSTGSPRCWRTAATDRWRRVRS